MAARGPIGLPARADTTGGLYPSQAALGVPRAAPRQRVGRHLLLFAATFGTAALAYAFEQVDVVSQPLGILIGVPYAASLMAILLAHEFGHYLTARAHAVDATLPFFIPAPPSFFLGTFGAFIRMRSQPPSRRALFDIGAAGPWAGIAVAIPAVIVGLALSEVRLGHAADTLDLFLGDSLLFRGLSWLVLGTTDDEAAIILHPIAFAGWVGFLVTAINLIPAGQLDGGHVVYAALGERWHRLISIGTVAALLALGLTGAWTWLLLAALLAVLGLRHPPLAETTVGLDRRRGWGAAATLLLFILTFTPEPTWRASPTPPVPRFPEAIPVAVPVPPPAGDGVWL